jgi:hypothetical protein
MDLDRWVNDNNPDEQLQYGKGWWDYIELIRVAAGDIGALEATGPGWHWTSHQVRAGYVRCEGNQLWLT